MNDDGPSAADPTSDAALLAGLPREFREVLDAVLLPAPSPPDGPLDTFVEAIHRRLPHLSAERIVDVLEALDRLGLIDVKTTSSFVSSLRTENLGQWMTEKGWVTLMDGGLVC